MIFKRVTKNNTGLHTGTHTDSQLKIRHSNSNSLADKPTRCLLAPAVMYAHTLLLSVMWP